MFRFIAFVDYLFGLIACFIRFIQFPTYFLIYIRLNMKEKLDFHPERQDAVEIRPGLHAPNFNCDVCSVYHDIKNYLQGAGVKLVK